MYDEAASTRARRERPGCVTAYAILLWIGAGLSLLAAFVVGFPGTSDLVDFGLCLFGITLLFAAIPVAAGIGLWQMRKWGWALIIVLQSLAIISTLVQVVVFALAGPGDNLSLFAGSITGLAVSSFIIYWFVTNRELFNGRTEYKEAIGPDGETIMEPVERKGSDTMTILAVVGGIAAVSILVCIVVIAMLAILGPQIGNVFSQITYTLDNPPPGVILRPW